MARNAFKAGPLSIEGGVGELAGSNDLVGSLGTTRYGSITIRVPARQT